MTRDRDDLEPIEPHSARELFLEHKATECADATVQSYGYRLEHLVDWCEEEGIDNLNDLTGRDIQRYRIWRKNSGDLNKMTMNAQMSTLRVFLKWAASIEAVEPNLYDKVMVPRVKVHERKRDEKLEPDTAQEILDYLTRYHYASIEHVVLALLWETGIRIGAAKGIDVDDVDVDEETVEIVHRPEQGTELKNGEGGERPIAITSELAHLLEDYVKNQRIEVTDDHDREPLLTSSYGRLNRSAIREIVYRVTAPCFRGEECPDCERDTEKKCGEAVSPHAIRRGSITYFLASDVPEVVVSDRMNVSRKVLDEHYDERSEEIKLRQRRGYLDNI